MRKAIFNKFVSSVTLLSFVFSIVGNDILIERSWAASASLKATNILAKNQSKTPPPGTGIENISTPLRLGEIKCIYSPSKRGTRDEGRETIIHIQDAHCNYSAQHSIADTIGYLADNYNINLVALEGGRGNYDLSMFTDIKNPDTRRRVSDYFVKEGRVNGAEFFAINNPGKVKLFGIEDEKLYFKNLDAYRESLKFKEDSDKDLAALTHIVNNFKNNAYSRELKELDKKICEYRDKKIEFKDYIKFLVSKADARKIKIDSFVNAGSLANLLKSEDSIDFKKANSERSALIDSLSKTLSKLELEQLVKKSVEFTTGDITSEDYYGYLFKKAKLVDLNYTNLPNLVKYSEYVKKYETIDKVKLFEELKGLEEALFNANAVTDDHKTIWRLDKNLSIMKGMFSISLIKDEYDYYLANKDAFSAKNYIDFVNKRSQFYKLNFKIDDSISNLDFYLANMEKFYEYSLKRDEAFVKNIELKLKKERQNITILVSGGFHTGNLKKLFGEKGYTYIEVMPKIKADNENNPYFNLLSGGLTKFEEFIVKAVSANPQASNISIYSPLSETDSSEVTSIRPIIRAGAVVLEHALEHEPCVVRTPNGQAVFKPAEFDSAEAVTGGGVYKDHFVPSVTYRSLAVVPEVCDVVYEPLRNIRTQLTQVTAPVSASRGRASSTGATVENEALVKEEPQEWPAVMARIVENITHNHPWLGRALAALTIVIIPTTVLPGCGPSPKAKNKAKIERIVRSATKMVGYGYVYESFRPDAPVIGYVITVATTDRNSLIEYYFYTDERDHGKLKPSGRLSINPLNTLDPEVYKEFVPSQGEPYYEAVKRLLKTIDAGINTAKGPDNMVSPREARKIHGKISGRVIWLKHPPRGNARSSSTGDVERTEITRREFNEAVWNTAKALPVVVLLSSILTSCGRGGGTTTPSQPQVNPPHPPGPTTPIKEFAKATGASPDWDGKKDMAYGYAFGIGDPGQRVSQGGRGKMEAFFSSLAQAGAKATRIFIRCDDRTSWNGVLEDMEALLDIAGRKDINVRVIPVIYDNLLYDNNSNLFTNTNARNAEFQHVAALVGDIEDYLRKRGDLDRIIAWDLMNEPDERWNSEMENFVAELASIVKNSTEIPVTLGITAKRIAQLNPFIKRLGNSVDIYNIHYYPDYASYYGPLPSVARLRSQVSGLGDKPIFVGEYGFVEGVSGVSFADTVSEIYGQGYKGAIFWQGGCFSGTATFDYAAYKDWLTANGARSSSAGENVKYTATVDGVNAFIEKSQDLYSIGYGDNICTLNRMSGWITLIEGNVKTYEVSPVDLNYPPLSTEMRRICAGVNRGLAQSPEGRALCEEFTAVSGLFIPEKITVIKTGPDDWYATIGLSDRCLTIVTTDDRLLQLNRDTGAIIVTSSIKVGRGKRIVQDVQVMYPDSPLYGERRDEMYNVLRTSRNLVSNIYRYKVAVELSLAAFETEMDIQTIAERMSGRIPNETRRAIAGNILSIASGYEVDVLEKLIPFVERNFRAGDSFLRKFWEYLLYGVRLMFAPFGETPQIKWPAMFDRRVKAAAAGEKVFEDNLKSYFWDNHISLRFEALNDPDINPELIDTAKYILTTETGRCVTDVKSRHRDKLDCINMVLAYPGDETRDVRMTLSRQEDEQGFVNYTAHFFGPPADDEEAGRQIVNAVECNDGGKFTIYLSTRLNTLEESRQFKDIVSCRSRGSSAGMIDIEMTHRLLPIAVSFFNQLRSCNPTVTRDEITGNIVINFEFERDGAVERYAIKIALQRKEMASGGGVLEGKPNGMCAISLHKDEDGVLKEIMRPSLVRVDEEAGAQSALDAMVKFIYIALEPPSVVLNQEKIPQNELDETMMILESLTENVPPDGFIKIGHDGFSYEKPVKEGDESRVIPSYTSAPTGFETPHSLKSITEFIIQGGIRVSPATVSGRSIRELIENIRPICAAADALRISRLLQSDIIFIKAEGAVARVKVDHSTLSQLSIEPLDVLKKTTGKLILSLEDALAIARALPAAEPAEGVRGSSSGDEERIITEQDGKEVLRRAVAMAKAATVEFSRLRTHLDQKAAYAYVVARTLLKEASSAIDGSPDDIENLKKRIRTISPDNNILALNLIELASRNLIDVAAVAAEYGLTEEMLRRILLKAKYSKVDGTEDIYVASVTERRSARPAAGPVAEWAGELGPNAEGMLYPDGDDDRFSATGMVTARFEAGAVITNVKTYIETNLSGVFGNAFSSAMFRQLFTKKEPITGETTQLPAAIISLFANPIDAAGNELSLDDLRAGYLSRVKPATNACIVKNQLGVISVTHLMTSARDTAQIKRAIEQIVTEVSRIKPEGPEGSSQSRICCSISSTILKAIDDHLMDNAENEKAFMVMLDGAKSVREYLSKNTMLEVILDKPENNPNMILAMPLGSVDALMMARLNIASLLLKNQDGETLERAVGLYAHAIAVVTNRMDNIEGIKARLMEEAKHTDADNLRIYFVRTIFELALPGCQPFNGEVIRTMSEAEAVAMRSL